MCVRPLIIVTILNLTSCVLIENPRLYQSLDPCKYTTSRTISSQLTCNELANQQCDNYYHLQSIGCIVKMVSSYLRLYLELVTSFKLRTRLRRNRRLNSKIHSNYKLIILMSSNFYKDTTKPGLWKLIYKVKLTMRTLTSLSKT